MNKKQWIWITVGLVLFSILVSVAATSLVWAVKTYQKNQAKPDDGNGIYNASKIEEIDQMLGEYFIGDIDRSVMTEKMAKAMVEGLNDEWSYYMSAEEYESYLESVQNAYVGIGVTITWKDENPLGFTVIDVSPDSPAYRAGVQIGDIMAKVEGQSVTELGMDETKKLVRGEEGTEVHLTVLRGEETLELTIVRERIKTVNVTYELMDDGIGYIRIRNFEQNCANDTIAAIEEMSKQGLKGVVFDVRFNPGGLKSELVKLLDYLLPEGVLFRSVSYNGSEQEDRSDARFLDLPMAVLVNVDSYSAAEFFAAALQEYGAATIVGTQTYGKGYFQTTHLLADGSAVHISTGKYYTPNGVSLVGVGITPDRVVELTDEEYADLYYSRLEKETDKQLLEAIAAVGEQLAADS